VRFSCEQICTPAINAGRQVVERSRRTFVTAVGVKGLLSTRRESFVTWAFRRREASEKISRGLGGVGMGFWVVWLVWSVLVLEVERVALNWERIVWVDVIRSLRALRSVVEVEGAMALTVLLLLLWCGLRQMVAVW
jgi:hypothetical protein